MTNWFHKFLNPHCEHCLEERRESRICNSCETLKIEVTRIREENERLLDRLLEKPVETPTNAPLVMTSSLTVPWKVRQQMLEAEDRKRLELMRNAPKPDSQTKDLEIELRVDNDAIHTGNE